jgi:hypothetical protein
MLHKTEIIHLNFLYFSCVGYVKKIKKKKITLSLSYMARYNYICIYIYTQSPASPSSCERLSLYPSITLRTHIDFLKNPNSKRKQAYGHPRISASHLVPQAPHLAPLPPPRRQAQLQSPLPAACPPPPLHPNSCLCNQHLLGDSTALVYGP